MLKRGMMPSYRVGKVFFYTLDIGRRQILLGKDGPAQGIFKSAAQVAPQHKKDLILSLPTCVKQFSESDSKNQVFFTNGVNDLEGLHGGDMGDKNVLQHVQQDSKQ